MGTNYYARIIPKVEDKQKLKSAIDSNDYNTIEEMVKDMYSLLDGYTHTGGKIHLGKSSCGWKFLWNPAVYDSYRNACGRVKNSSELLGMIQVVQAKKGFYIVNLFGQDDYHSSTGRCTNYEAFYTGLEKIKKYIIDKNLPREVAFPCRIGSALAGGDWNVIYAMICSVFNNTDFKVVIYDFKK